jgi:hypothetical protein
MAEDGAELYVAKENANFDFKGQPVFVNAGTIVRAGHPIMKGRENLFEPLKVHYDLEKPAVKKEDPPVSSSRADQQHARTR